MENSKYNLCMKRVPSKILAELNSQLFGLGKALDLVKSLSPTLDSAVDTVDPNEFVLLDVTASVCGTSPKNAYLSVEMIMKGREATPLWAAFALPNSKSKNDGNVNKDFSDVHPYVKKVICDYWRSIATTLTLRGKDLSIEESRK